MRVGEVNVDEVRGQSGYFHPHPFSDIVYTKDWYRLTVFLIKRNGVSRLRTGMSGAESKDV